MTMNDKYSHSIGKYVNYKTDDPIFQIQEYNLDIRARHIYLVGSEEYVLPDSEGFEPGVEYAMANRFLKNLNILMRISDEPILIHMKTCGGFWEEGMAIYDAIKACPNDTTILSYTHARSMSSLIFLAADKKVMMPHSTFMFHSGDHAFDGTWKQLQTEAEEGKKTHDQMIDIYEDTLKAQGKLSKWSRKRIRVWVNDLMDKKEEVYFSSKQAVEYGFADEVFGSNGTYDWGSLIDYDEDEEEEE